MLALGDLLTQVQRKTPVVQIILNNESLDFVKIEMQEACFRSLSCFQAIRSLVLSLPTMPTQFSMVNGSIGRPSGFSTSTCNVQFSRDGVGVDEQVPAAERHRACGH